MAGSQDDFQDNPSDKADPKQKTNSNEDEIDLADYLRILWKRRFFILFGSLLPTLLAGLIFFLLPGKYSVTHIYNIEQEREVLTNRLYSAEEVNDLILGAQESESSEYKYKVLSERFYSSENMNRLAAQLRRSGRDEYSPKISNANIKLDVSSELLTLTIIGETQGDVQIISEVVRDNLENVIPLYSVNDKLRSAIASLKNRMSDIEKNRFYLKLELDKKRAILAKLKNLITASSNNVPDGIILHFNNVHECTEYLPLAYQVQATDSNIINIEETINVNEVKYNYYKALLHLNEKFVKEIEKQTPSYYTIEQYHSFLTLLASEYKNSELTDYVSGYCKEIENLMSINNPLVESPGIHMIPRDNIKKATIVFVALLMITTFAAFLIDSAQKSNTQAS